MLVFESQDEVRSRFPLHYHVWRNEFDELKKYLKKHPNTNVELHDPRGRTPLMLAVALDHKKCAKILMNNNALVNVTDSSGFNVLHEAVTSLDPEFIFDVCQQKRLQTFSTYRGIPQMLQKMAETSDFYVEMKWDFSSWLPMVSNLFPADSYKIYKSGSKLRVDFTLTGIASGGMAGVPKWIKGSKSYIFINENDGGTIYAVDHEKKQVSEDQVMMGFPENVPDVSTQDEVEARLSKPIETAFLDTEQIQFERARRGLIFSSDKSEVIDGFNCDVYNSVNAQFVQKCRLEHLSEKESKNSLVRSSVASLIGLEEKVLPNPFKDQVLENARNPHNISLLDYFNRTDMDKDVGISRDMIIRSYKLQASLSMSESYPLSLPEQIQPILNLLAMTSSHFTRLRDFVQTKIPPGFPVKIEIPLFHFLTAHITFRNVFGLDKPVEGVATCNDNPEKPKCVIDPSIFVPSPDYEKLTGESSSFNQFDNENDDVDEEDDFQKVIEMSLKEFQKSQELQDIQKQLQNPQKHQRESQAPKAADKGEAVPAAAADEEDDEDDAFEDAVQNFDEPKKLSPTGSNASTDEQMRRALEQSKSEHDAEEARRAAQEEAELEKAIQKSLQDQ